MVTVVKTPQGHKLIDQAIEATVTDSGGDALVTLQYHGLGTGDHVYIDSNLDEYNGFWYVTAINADTFKLSEYAGADFVEYYQDADIDYYQTNNHVWNSIFLPIIYKITNDRWPTNTVDTARTISSVANDNGFLDITASGVLNANIAALHWVKITGASDDSYNGIWQVIEVITTSRIVIDAPYQATGITGATIQFYYNNYQVKVKVYAGLPSDHPWESKKPYEEMAELSFTPDENGLVMFSIADYIRGKVAIKNNPTLFSMPLNLDAFTAFYIATGESYDDSSGYAISTGQLAYTNDDFVGYAVAGKLPFKNIYSGDYADYIYTDGSPALWLTNMTRLLAVEDKYFDISFIKNGIGSFTVYIDKYIADYLTTTETVAYADQGIGVYRIPITADATYDSFCVRVVRDATGVPFTPAVMDDLDTWSNVNSGGPAWALDGAIPEADTAGLGLAITTDEWQTAYAFEAGQNYSFAYTLNSDSTTRTFHIDIIDVGGNMLTSKSITTASTVSGTYTFVAPVGATGISIWFYQGPSCGGAPGVDCVGRIEAFTNETEAIPALTAVDLTEEICIDMLESCEAVSGFTPTDIRLLEDGSYRILE